MPYTGKPSKGCGTCKSRRIKCDEKRPICGNCIKSGRDCPGYRDEFDLMFRDENKAMAKKSRRNNRKTPARNVDDRSNDQCLTFNSTPNTSLQPSPSRTSRSATPQLAVESSYRQLEIATHYGVPNDQNAWNTFLWNLQHDVPPTITLSPEFEAVPFFFRNFVSLPQQADSMRGYLELLLPLYNRSSPSSALHLATVAVSLAACGNYPGRGSLQPEAARIYGQALGKLNEDLQDPVAARSDESILATLLFSLYETVTSTQNTITGWGNHVDGAVALTKLRGTEQFKDPISHAVFRAVRTMMITSCVQRSKPIEEPFPGAEGWIGGNDINEENAANRLTLLCINLPEIRSRAKRIREKPYSPSIEKEVLEVREFTQMVDNNLLQWYQTLPDTWWHRTVGFMSEPIEDGSMSSMWMGEQHVYHDVPLATIVNDYRVCRIFCQRVIMSCTEWLANNPAHKPTPTIPHSVYIIQQMVDEICACVPFHLSYEMQPTAKELGQDKNAAEALGGYSLVWPLYVGANAETVPQRQRDWLFGRLYLIGMKFGLSHAQVLVLAKQHVLTCGPSFP
ncbi:hypothetical protein P280DRAFT_401158 [Massarina eburnea CBS 473.64]|uniref:Zn(2)-C6 fungal-type domain-containing protein n=1 Tax=Massarina eburnea CBS 473.64 TaxID=1395130 RepID=A0A6A6RXV0_9PLEO|nr:hypothetical protein P280DRAFT_401158 [Massarina eburnea CBS 473.64]